MRIQDIKIGKRYVTNLYENEGVVIPIVKCQCSSACEFFEVSLEVNGATGMVSVNNFLRPANTKEEEYE